MTVMLAQDRARVFAQISHRIKPLGRSTIALLAVGLIGSTMLNLAAVAGEDPIAASDRPDQKGEDKDKDQDKNRDQDKHRGKGHVLRVLSVKPHVPEKDEPSDTNLIEQIVFDYREGQAYRILYDSTTRRIVNREPLPGTPQPSPEEINDVRDVIRRDPVHANLLSLGNVLEGGFAVEGPPGSPDRDRFVQMQMLSPDRKAFVRIITVDLTTRQIVASVPKE
jgi:hypothetical protein